MLHVGAGKSKQKGLCVGLLLTPAGNATRTAAPLTPRLLALPVPFPSLLQTGRTKCLVLVAKFGCWREKDGQ